jgi:hypothetical protein
MRQVIFLLNQLGIVLLTFGFGFLGTLQELQEIKDILWFLVSVFLGTFMMASSLWYIGKDVVKRNLMNKSYAVYNIVLLSICETGISFIATGLSFLSSGQYIVGAVFLIVSLMIILLTSSGLVLFKYVFFDFDE